MCWRQWVIFYCGDLRYVEFRCDQNPSSRSFESCDTRQTTAISKAATCVMSHPDPDLLSFPGRCVDWGRIPGNTFGNTENILFNTFTWIVCGKEWHTANPVFFNNAVPNPCIDDASSNSKTGTSEGLQKKLKISSPRLATLLAVILYHGLRYFKVVFLYDTNVASKKAQLHVVKEAYGIGDEEMAEIQTPNKCL